MIIVESESLKVNQTERMKRKHITSCEESYQSQSSSPPVIDLEQKEIQTASAILSLSGPCRNAGDIYLACVATSGLGMCRSLRASFEHCSKDTAQKSQDMLRTIGAELCPDANSVHEQTLCAARMINEQLFEPKRQ